MTVAISRGEGFWLALLLMSWATLLFGGFVLGQTSADGKRRMPGWTRLLSSFVLVLAAWIWYGYARAHAVDDADETLALLIALGMTLGFIGDLFMAKLIIRDDNYVLGGMAAFGLGHVAYIVGFLGAGDAFGLDDSGARWGALIAWLVVAPVAWYIVVYRGSQPTVMHLAALPYALLLASTAGVATGLALQEGAFVAAAVGAALFLLSDLILAAELFNNLHFKYVGDVVWLLYGPGQMLIVFAMPLRALF
jgi:hypothetical protein